MKGKGNGPSFFYAQPRAEELCRYAAHEVIYNLFILY